ncbi:MAG: AbrB/MazE/SpoVT family DNA-binding domain-containing protein [Candidatus Thiosymbion ectosymbiont of Robbea hypermnestra]|nr:AbrB/MazE/SpoVT family DNA-binding domain-containing protein [Candidatus Thiosymbion ectosymbiont of Robbea hypermnestra]
MLAATVKISGQGQVIIPRNMVDSLHWTDGMELTLVTTESGVMLIPKTHKKLSANSLRGSLQHEGEPIPTERLCKPVEYTNDSV